MSKRFSLSKIIECFKSFLSSEDEDKENIETSLPNNNVVEFNIDEGEVEEKYNKFKSLDPYPSIPPALLNSVDIHNYILATGMISPYYPSQLKPVTYGIKLTNADYLYWGEDRVRNAGSFRHSTDIDDDGDIVFLLKSNSIVYVSMESYLRLPVYIAARFNLKIDYIHKGILLGTGPVVDPGFAGRLCIPLHNLTNNDYKIKVNHTFIWMEFTKISPHPRWANSKDETLAHVQPTVYDNTQKGRMNRNLSDYLHKANPNGSISSSIVEHKKEVEKVLKKAEKALEKTESLNKAFLWAVVVSLTSIAISFFTFQYRVFSFDRTNSDEINIMQNKVEDLNVKIDSLNTMILNLTKESNQEKPTNTLDLK
ncbi:MAG: hypothetical protein LBS55_14055 [Prevotellaceae bacterium]|jgi:deoxycytidine triphosphate deaminase/cell division protein FtsL|nr:hypothetical protein [Prevotellaceae bacterium]